MQAIGGSYAFKLILIIKFKPIKKKKRISFEQSDISKTTKLKFSDNILS